MFLIIIITGLSNKSDLAKLFIENRFIMSRKGFNDRIKNVLNKSSIVMIAKRLGLELKDDKFCDCINPAHFGDKNSMELLEEKNQFKCNRCGFSGNTIDLVRVKLNVTKYKAVDFIEGKIENDPRYNREYSNPLGVRVENKDKNNNVLNFVSKKDNRQHGKRRVPQDNIFKNIYWFFYNQLTSINRLPFSIEYLKVRNIQLSTCDRLGIRYLGDYHKISTRLKSEFEMKDLIASGLFVEDVDSTGIKRQKMLFEMHKIVFPFFNFNRIVYIQGRLLNAAEPQNLNRELPVPYNMNTLKEVKKGGTLNLVCGVLNTLELMERGYNAVIGLVEKNKIQKDWLKHFMPYQINIIKLKGSIKDDEEILSMYNELEGHFKRVRKSYKVKELE